MLSNNQAKLIRSLQKKKQRDISGLYVVEGDKLVTEYLESNEEIVILAAKSEWLSWLDKSMKIEVKDVVEVSDMELKRISSLHTPHNSLAVVKSRKNDLSEVRLEGSLSIALDFIQDPGNLGTIIRTAAWFGIKNIICSNNCVDLHNPKVIQSTMGGMLVTNTHYTDLSEYLEKADKAGINIYAATLDGISIYESDFHHDGIILFGNESMGVSRELLPYITRKLMIPVGGTIGPGVESLNVATSAAVICSEFIRRKNTLAK